MIPLKENIYIPWSRLINVIIQREIKADFTTLIQREKYGFRAFWRMETLSSAALDHYIFVLLCAIDAKNVIFALDGTTVSIIFVSLLFCKVGNYAVLHTHTDSLAWDKERPAPCFRLLCARAKIQYMRHQNELICSSCSAHENTCVCRDLFTYACICSCIHMHCLSCVTKGGPVGNWIRCARIGPANEERISKR